MSTRWEVCISGQRNVLTKLSKKLRGPEWELVESDGVFVVCGSRVNEQLAQSEPVTKANEIVTFLSGIAALLFGSSEPLTVAGVRDIRPDGTSSAYAVARSEGMAIVDGDVRAQLIGADGKMVPQPLPASPVPEWLDMALSDPHVAKAFRLRSCGALDFTGLYRAYEVIEGALGGQKAVIARCNVSKTEIRRLKHTADSVAAAGDEARHE
jgi:hypothetical protein